MAKVQFSAAVGDLRNKVGGAVFTKTRAGAMLRRKVSPTQPHTSAQMAVRANFSALAKSWSSDLSAIQRASWNELAKSYPVKDVFGAAHPLTGLQLYISLNRNLQVIGQTAIADAPASLAVDNLATLAVDASTPTAIVLSDCQVTGDEVIYTYTSFTGTGPVIGMAVTVAAFVQGVNNGVKQILSTTGGAAGTFTTARIAEIDETHAGTGTGVGLSVSFTVTPLAANMHLVIAGSRQASAGRATSFASPATIKTFAPAATSPQSILSEYQTKYGTLVAGRKINIAAYIVNDVTGAASLHMTTQDTVG